MVRTYAKAAVSGLVLICLWATPGWADPDPSGVWMRGDGNARVRIAPCGQSYCATNIWVKDTSKGEAVGDLLVMKLKRKSGTELEGEAFDAKRNLSYNMTVSFETSGLVSKGCVIGGVVCLSMNWAPVN
ncbi:DUF2147 domain-containing protein [Xanthobacteraceae bacterium A53D]